MTRRLLAECHDFALAEERERTIFIGDSPNDAPMFAFFPYAIGVANVRDALSRLTHEPAYVTRAACGAGFREAADFILAAKDTGSL
jgi:hydroxymethylpyrimidine pyrophosphatase-like HAD family hydrolase